MKYKKIKLEDNKSILIDETVEIRETSWDITKYKDIFKKSNTLKNNNFGYYYKNGFKIIATINHSIDKDIPMVFIDDEVEELAEVYYKINLLSPYHGDSTKKDYLNCYRAGHKAAQQKGVYSEQDIRNIVRLTLNDAKEAVIWSNDYHNHLSNKLLQDINQEYVELEMEKCEFCDDNNIYVDADNNKIDCLASNNGKSFEIKTTKVDGQLMAFVKQ